MIHRIKGFVRGQHGFTLIELLAVMAILATLVAIVAPAVAGTREASIQAQAQQDGSQVRTAANKYFSSINASETRTQHTITTSTFISTAVNATPTAIANAVPQIVSNRWPEKYITLDVAATGSDVALIGASYTDVFNTATSASSGVPGMKDVNSVTLLDNSTPANIITAANFFRAYTAIDMGPNTGAVSDNSLVTKGFLAKQPAGLGMTSQGKPNFLWLLSKTSSSSALERQNDSRDIAVFKLVKVERMESPRADGANLNLTYQLIFGSAP